MDPGLLWILCFVAVMIGAVLWTKWEKKRKTSGWQINYSVGTPSRPTEVDGKQVFDIPLNETGGHIHYVQWYDAPKPLLGSTVQLRFKVEAADDVRFIPVEHPDRVALVTLMIQRQKDNMRADEITKSYRWFNRSQFSVPLAPGEYTLSVPLLVENWGDVFGGRDAAEFRKTLENHDNISVLFGSEGGRGHGVQATGKAVFTIIDVTIKTPN